MRNLLLIVSITLFSSCQSSSQRDNPEDKAAAEAVVSKFFDYRKQKDEQKMYSLFSERFYKRNDSTYIKRTLQENEELYGKITGIKLLRSSTHTSSRFFVNLSTSIFLYEVSSTKGTWRETYTISLRKGEYKIGSFTIPNAIGSGKKPLITD